MINKTETDPHGLSPHQAGAKLDAGKLRAGLVLGDFSHALQEVAAVGTFGANKYTPGGWKEVPDAKARYMDAMWRHLLGGPFEKDSQTGLDHLAHVAWNALAILELQQTEKDFGSK